MKMPLEADAKQPKTAANLQSSATKSSSVAPSNCNEQRSTRRSNAEKHNNTMSQVKNTAVKAQSSKVAPQPQNEVEPKDTQAAAKGVDTVMPKLTKEEEKSLKRHEEAIQKGQATVLKVMVAFKEIRDEKLYRAEYNSFGEYCEKRWGFGRAHGNRLAKAGKVYERLEEASTDGSTLPETESHVRPLTRLKPKDWDSTWKEAVELADGKPVTAELVEQAVNAKLGDAPAKKPKTAEPVKAKTGPDEVMDCLTRLKAFASQLPSKDKVLPLLEQVEGLLKPAKVASKPAKKAKKLNPEAEIQVELAE